MVETPEQWEARMLADPETKTPETHPDHQTVGRRWRSMGRTYRCTWYNPRAGFQMRSDDDGEPRNVNVSERAIGATFREIYED